MKTPKAKLTRLLSFVQQYLYLVPGVWVFVRVVLQSKFAIGLFYFTRSSTGRNTEKICERNTEFINVKRSIDRTCGCQDVTNTRQANILALREEISTKFIINGLNESRYKEPTVKCGFFHHNLAISFSETGKDPRNWDSTNDAAQFHSFSADAWRLRFTHVAIIGPRALAPRVPLGS